MFDFPASISQMLGRQVYVVVGVEFKTLISIELQPQTIVL